jgi:hypothetical protein
MVAMPETQVAIVIPTYRFDMLARNTLAQAASMGSDTIHVHIADNSENPAKHAFLQDCARRNRNVVVTCHEKNIGPEGNWSFLIKAQTAPYVCIAADDDIYGGAYFEAGLNLIRADPACAAASGLHLSLAHLEGQETPFVLSPADRGEMTAFDRISRYGGENTMAYTISKHEIVRRFADFVDANPLKCPFNDMILAYHVLSIGTYRMDRSGYAYVYNNTKWQTIESFVRSNSSYYRTLGMPEGMGQLTRLHMAAALAHFFSSTFRAPTLSNAEASAIASHLFWRYRQDFKDLNYKLLKGNIDQLFSGKADGRSAFDAFLSTPYKSLAPALDDFARIVAMFSPDIAARNRAFQSATQLPQAGSFTPPLSRLAVFTRRAKRLLGC